MKKFGVKSREEREKEKNANKLITRMSFTISDNLKKEIEELKVLGNFNSNSEFLRVCVGINKTLMKLAKSGHTEIAVLDPKTQKRVFIHLGHLVKISEGEEL